MPNLVNCGLDGMDSSFDSLFDASAILSAGALALSSFNVARECGGEGAAIFVAVGGDPHLEKPKDGEGFELGGLRIPAVHARGLMPKTPEEAVRPVPGHYSSGPTSVDEMMHDALYASYFAPRMAADSLVRYCSEPLLPDKLARRHESCLVIGNTFMSLNWPRLPGAFAEVGQELIPHASIRSDADEFLARQGLDRCPFVAVHLRMDDFLTIESHASFGLKCNNRPEELAELLQKLLSSEHVLRGPARGECSGPATVLATDDYDSACAVAMAKAFPHTILLKEASRFVAASCRESLFDQEVLARSAAFVGDSMSTFSQAINQIRTLRFGRSTSSTVWV